MRNTCLFLFSELLPSPAQLFAVTLAEDVGQVRLCRPTHAKLEISDR